MADVHFLLHFRPRPRPLGLDWPRQRPVASRCGTVGATPLSVGGRRGKMDAGGTGPTSDTGWGCMLRCGQMIFAQALVCRHLGRDWRWTQRKRQPDSYFNVLNAFIDRKDSYYSIHQIAQMGVGEGKSIGQWYGPNTVAQVLKKLAVFDTWSALAVHIAMDNTVVMEDIRRLCSGSLPCAGAASLSADSSRHCNGFPAGAEVTDRPAPWRPLVLLIPLRLGLTDINEAYVETLKRCFMMPQSLGVIGGKPNSAHYFIGYAGEELIYLDPHTTQPAVELTDSCFIADESFHCRHPPSRMSIGELDPSIAVGFFCKTEDDFDDWCQQVRQVGGGSPHVGWAGGRLSRGLQFGVPPPSAPGAGLAVWLVASTSLCVENVGTDLAREPWAGGLRFVSAVATRGGSKWSLPPGLWFAALHGSDRRGLMMADSAEGQESLSSETASPSSSTVSPAGSADLWAGARGCTPMAVSNSSVC
uniref:Cysteine protease n=1 Tax=Ailuropoda melanoleuca TaxID=9646 RepID=A0A7N5KPX9_AILME